MKNPFMSLFLSNANRIASSARGHATAAVKREALKNTARISDAWIKAVFPALPATRKKKARRK
jgi:hypothetical protein